MHRLTVEMIAIGAEHIILHSLLGHRLGGQHDPLRPFLHRHAELHALPRLVSPFHIAGLAGSVAHDLVGEPDVELQRAGGGIDLIGYVGDPQALDLLLRPHLRFHHRHHRPVLGGGLRDLGDVEFKALSLDEQCLVIGEHGKGIAGVDVLATFNRDLLHQQRRFGICGRREAGSGRGPHDNRSQQRTRRDDFLNLCFAEAMEQERLPLRNHDRGEFLQFVLSLQDRFDRDDPFRTDPLQPGNFPPYDHDLLGSLEQVCLGLNQFLVCEAHLKERLLRGDGLPLGEEDFCHKAGHRGDDREF